MQSQGHIPEGGGASRNEMMIWRSEERAWHSPPPMVPLCIRTKLWGEKRRMAERSFEKWASSHKPPCRVFPLAVDKRENRVPTASYFPCCQGQATLNTLVLTLETTYQQAPATKLLPTSLGSAPVPVHTPTLHCSDTMWGDSAHSHTMVSWLPASTSVFLPCETVCLNFYTIFIWPGPCLQRSLLRRSHTPHILPLYALLCIELTCFQFWSPLHWAT